MNKIHHGDTENTEKSRRFSRRSLRLCVFCVKYSLPVLVAGLLAHTVATTHAQTHQPIPPEKRLRYQLKLALDFDNLAYTGTEHVRNVYLRQVKEQPPVNRPERNRPSHSPHGTAQTRAARHTPKAPTSRRQLPVTTSDGPRYSAAGPGRAGRRRLISQPRAGH